MKLNKFAYLYSKPLGNHTLKIMKKIPGNLLKNLEKSWKYHRIFSVQKSGNPEKSLTYFSHACQIYHLYFLFYLIVCMGITFIWDMK